MKNFVTKFNIVLSGGLLLGISLSFVWVAYATAPNPGHNFTEVSGGAVQGDLIYGSAADTFLALAKNATASRYLSNSGASNNPAWAQVDLTNGVTGTLPSANGGRYRTLVTLGSDVVNNNGTANTIATCTGLSFSVTSGTTYRFHATIIYTAAAATTGSRWAMTGPTTTLLAYTSNYQLTATTQTLNYVTAYDTPAASNATSATAGNMAIIEGIVLPSANGTMAVRFASEVASSAITCKAGSTLEWW